MPAGASNSVQRCPFVGSEIRVIALKKHISQAIAQVSGYGLESAGVSDQFILRAIAERFEGVLESEGDVACGRGEVSCVGGGGRGHWEVMGSDRPTG